MHHSSPVLLAYHVPFPRRGLADDPETTSGVEFYLSIEKVHVLLIAHVPITYTYSTRTTVRQHGLANKCVSSIDRASEI